MVKCWQILLELNSKGLHQSSGREKQKCCLLFRPRQKVKFGVSRCSCATTAQKCTKECDARAKLLFCLSKPIAFLPFSLPSSSSLRKLPNVVRAVQTDPTLLRHASAITEQKKCWELLALKFDQFQTLLNNMQKHVTGCANGRKM